MKVGDMVAVTHKEISYGPNDRYFGILVVGPIWDCICIVCNRDGNRRNFNPRDWDVEVVSESR